MQLSETAQSTGSMLLFDRAAKAVEPSYQSEIGLLFF